MRAVKRERFILIVEDDETVREGMTLLLEDAGHAVAAVGNGLEALELMKSRVPCLVLLDLMMPVMTGWALHAAMRADPRLSRVPICVVSAVTAQAPADVEHVLEKPVHVPSLLELCAGYC
jgi:CheY-like chemotaxis protein